jgi:hypothetical protein
MALLVTASVAADGQHRIVVLGSDEELFRAISLSLSPWGVETTRSDAPPPQSSQPEAVDRATELARELDVEAVVWISQTERGALVWVFDQPSGSVTTRTLTEAPPFDSAAAAAVALSVKTVLRSSVVAPPVERFEPPPAPPPVEPARTERPPPEQRPSERFFAVEAGAGRWWISDGQAELNLTGSVVAWVAAAKRVGVSLEGSYGSALKIEEASFSGRYREIAAGASVRFRWLREPDVSAAVSLGASVVWTELEGTVLESSLEQTVRRVNGSLDADANINAHFGRFYVGAMLGAAYSPKYQRYLVEGEPVLSRWPFVVGLGGYGGAELF